MIVNSIMDRKDTAWGRSNQLIWIKKRLFVGVLAVSSLLLAGCGGADGGSGGDSGEVRTVEHAMGETEVKGTPGRVVVLDTGELDSAMSLGVTPVGAVEAVEGLGLPSYLQGTGGIENVGTIEEPNLEKIATLEPDLILSSKLRHEPIYDQLSQIAPTVFTKTTGVTWKANFEKHAEAMNRTGEAKKVMEGYEDRLEQFGNEMGDELKETEVSVVRFLPGETRIYQKASFIGTVLEDAGLPRPPSQDVDEFAILNASEETIPDMGGDAIFVTAYGPEDETTREKITSDPLWRKLDAVREGRVYEASDDLWMLGIGPTAAVGVVDDLENHLVK
jgi:iron complex transport system substrate-binding protein